MHIKKAFPCGEGVHRVCEADLGSFTIRTIDG